MIVDLLQNRQITEDVGNENCGFEARIKAEFVSRSRQDFNFAIDQSFDFF